MHSLRQSSTDFNNLDSPLNDVQPKKMLKIDNNSAFPNTLPSISLDEEDKENLTFMNNNMNESSPKKPMQHIEDLSMEEGAILLDRWTNNNFCDFEFWLQNAQAQATFNIDEKVSFNSKPTKAKTVQIKNYQCH